MDLVYHGGKCCGIKTIHGLGYKPEEMAYKLEALPKKTCNDVDGEDVSSDLRFYHLAAPEETKLERLKRYIQYCKERRPQGMIEIALASYSWGGYQDVWFPTLESLGFRKLIENKNSNTSNIISVWYLAYDEGADDEDDDDYYDIEEEEFI